MHGLSATSRCPSSLVNGDPVPLDSGERCGFTKVSCGLDSMLLLAGSILDGESVFNRSRRCSLDDVRVPLRESTGYLSSSVSNGADDDEVESRCEIDPAREVAGEFIAMLVNGVVASCSCWSFQKKQRSSEGEIATVLMGMMELSNK